VIAAFWCIGQLSSFNNIQALVHSLLLPSFQPSQTCVDPLLLLVPFHPQAYKDSGDTASKKGDRIWIAEMYGYSFGAAKSNVWHIWKEDFMLYPSYTPNSEWAIVSVIVVGN
jgi:hypothetical protein